MTIQSTLVSSALALAMSAITLGSQGYAGGSQDDPDITVGGIGIKSCIFVSRCFKPEPSEPKNEERVRDHRGGGKVRDHRTEKVRDHRGPAGPAIDPRARDNGPAGPATNPRAGNGPAGPAKKSSGQAGPRVNTRVNVAPVKARIDLNRYCRNVRGVKAKLKGRTAFDWVCYADRNTMWGIDMRHACKRQHNLPVARVRNRNDPYSWYCTT